MNNQPSRLHSGDVYYQGQNISIEDYRNMITSRSLYSLDNEYENNNKFSLKNKGNVASSISTVLNVIPQYNRMQVNSNLLGNTYDAFRDEGSPLAKIGLIMLGKHMTYNSAMNLSVRYLPSIDLSQALKGNPKNIFKFNLDNSITEKSDKKFLDKVGDISSKILGIETYDVFGKNPFIMDKSNWNNRGYIENTGKAQIARFYSAINYNIYKPINEDNIEFNSKIAKKAGSRINLSRESIIINKETFNFDKKNINPYLGFKVHSDSIDETNKVMNKAYSIDINKYQEYAPTLDSIINNFGTTNKSPLVSNLYSYTPESIVNNISDNLVWGRDGVSDDVEINLHEYHGDNYDYNPSNKMGGEPFKIRKGLLEYTRNLLNATDGQLVDITRKAFKRDSGVVGYQGSALWKSNNSDYAQKSETNDHTGVRQHTVLDQYDRFAKAIRFQGNEVYDGNPNSVINKSVLPRTHPTNNDEGVMNNKNLMFSLENLAIGTIVRDTYGVIDDEYGTAIPKSEVGPFNGRLMWFPPYNLEINETATAAYESTVMIGRNEPMYNYMNSERTAMLSFTLIMDYPPQLKGNNYTGTNKNKAIADFFAFGGDKIPREAENNEKIDKIYSLEREIEKIGNPVDQAEPPSVKIKDMSIFFPNDVPKINDDLNSIINKMYNVDNYEIIDGLYNDNNGMTSDGLNDKIYYQTGLTKGSGNTWTYDGFLVDQYNVSATIDQLGENELNVALKKAFDNEDTRKYYTITISGSASILYLNKGGDEYNKKLGNRRAKATANLIRARLTALYGSSVADKLMESNVEISESLGSVGSSPEGEFKENINLKVVREDRRSTISITRKTVPVDKKTQNLTEEQREAIKKLREEIIRLERDIAVSKLDKEDLYKERHKTNGIYRGFESISNNIYYPTFHSQTPEDFHRRLTFLQQCTRQGAAKRYDIIDDNGEFKARNSVFGRQPICILRIGDFFYTKVIIETVTIDYAEAPWDMNPEGFGMQPMIANVTLNMKVIGGQSLKGPIDALQNAVSFNYYANSSFSDQGMYVRPSREADKQASYMKGILTEKENKLNAAYDATFGGKVTEGDV